MEYQFIHFKNDQYQDYCTFLNGFKKRQFLEIPWDSPQSESGLQNGTGDNSYTNLIFFAYTSTEIASRCCLSERRLWYRGDVINCFEIGGTTTLPHHQRRGLFTKLVKDAMKIGFSTEHKLIYGTPNERSGPGYRKLNYSFVDQENSFFVLRPCFISPLIRKLGIEKGQIEHIKKQNKQTRPFHSSIFSEIDIEDYFEATRDFPRMNYVDETYFDKRFDRHKTDSTRRFFKVTTQRGDFFCALKDHDLSFLKLIIVSEYFLNGKIDNSYEKFRLIRSLASIYYRNYDGVYLKCSIEPDVSRVVLFLKSRLIVHRKLPICYINNPDFPDDKVHSMMEHLVKVFQLTDCDIA